MKVRIISGAVGLGLFLAVMLLHEAAAFFLLYILAVLCLFELFPAFEKAGHKPICPIALLASPVILWGLLSPSYEMPVLLTIVFSFLVTFGTIVVFHRKYSLIDGAVTFLGTVYIVITFSFIAFTRAMPDGARTVWLIFAGTWGADTGAYFIGKLFGKRKLVPELSPNKTVAGAFGGILGGMLAVLLVGLFISSGVRGLAVYDYLLIGLICGIVSQFGDIFASLIKRYAKIKDFGSVIPGHGGILDRFDGVLFTAPFVYVYLAVISGI